MFGDDTWVSLFPDMYVLPSDQGVSPFTCSFSPFPSFLPLPSFLVGVALHQPYARETCTLKPRTVFLFKFQTIKQV